MAILTQPSEETSTGQQAVGVTEETEEPSVSMPNGQENSASAHLSRNAAGGRDCIQHGWTSGW